MEFIRYQKFKKHILQNLKMADAGQLQDLIKITKFMTGMQAYFFPLF